MEIVWHNRSFSSYQYKYIHAMN